MQTRKTLEKIASDGSKFSNPGYLNDAWLEQHKDHSLVNCFHTVFSGTQGSKYKETRCYTCSLCARVLVGEVIGVVQIALPEPKAKRKYTKRS
jgi:hypothetical protein